MRIKITRTIPVLVAVAALGTGGVAAVAMAGSNSPAEPVASVDTDNVQLQVGDQTTPDTTTNAAETTPSVDTDNIQSQVGDQSTPDTTPSAAETTSSDTDNIQQGSQAQGPDNNQQGSQNEQGGENQEGGGNDPAGGLQSTANFQGDFQGQQ